MKKITRKEAQRRLSAEGITSQIAFGTTLNLRVNETIVSVFCSDTRGRNVRIDRIRVSPFATKFGGSMEKSMKVAKHLRNMLGVPVEFETGSIGKGVYQID